MNDRFKFRFYHYETETMYDVKAICFEGRPIVTVQYNPVLKFPLDSGKLTQCTGLKDKNGKLIFDGDLVRVDCLNKDFVIVYEENFCGIFSGFVLRRIDDTFDSVTPSFITDSRVIGNIHENEELLK